MRKSPEEGGVDMIVDNSIASSFVGLVRRPAELVGFFIGSAWLILSLLKGICSTLYQKAVTSDLF